MAPVTVSFATLGCRLNQVESQELMGLLEGHGFRAVAGEEPAQVYVVNTCTVTGRADSLPTGQVIRRISRENPGAVLVVTGCLRPDGSGRGGRAPRRGSRPRQPGEVPAPGALDLAWSSGGGPRCR